MSVYLPLNWLIRRYRRWKERKMKIYSLTFFEAPLGAIWQLKAENDEFAFKRAEEIGRAQNIHPGVLSENGRMVCEWPGFMPLY